MGFSSRGITSAEILAAICADSTQFNGADVLGLRQIDFWGAPATVQLSSVAASKTLSSVTLPNLSGYTIEAAYILFLPHTVMNTHATSGNFIDGDQVIQIDTGSAGWLTGLTLDDDMFKIEGLDAAPYNWSPFLVGNVDVKAKVAFNGTSDLQWTSAKCYTDNLNFYGLYTGVRVLVS